MVGLFVKNPLQGSSFSISCRMLSVRLSMTALGNQNQDCHLSHFCHLYNPGTPTGPCSQTDPTGPCLSGSTFIPCSPIWSLTALLFTGAIQPCWSLGSRTFCCSIMTIVSIQFIWARGSWLPISSRQAMQGYTGQREWQGMYATPVSR